MVRLKKDPDDPVDGRISSIKLDIHHDMEEASVSNVQTEFQTPEQQDEEMCDDSQQHQNPQINTGLENIPVDDAMQSIGASSRELIGFIQNLEALNIKNTLPSLPKFVVVGDQSAGKSSVIEALCDIKLPRGEGTCTRCPFKITTTSSQADSWVCRITVHQKYSYDATAEAHERSPYKFWVEENDVSISEIAVTRDKEGLELELRRAQVAVLNPKTPPADFLGVDMAPYLASKDMESEGLISVAFSPNWVALEIASPDLPDLSLYDLPGAIQMHPDEDRQYLRQFIGDLMKSYMKEQKTLVLLACPMNSDIHNSTAFNYIRECGAIGRSMGVRTKPDTIILNQKRLDQEIPLLTGNEFKLRGGGWYITKQLSQEELDQGNISYAQARQIEKDFFSQPIWKKVLGAFIDRLGIPNLQAALSDRLTTHIREEIPTIAIRIQNRRSQVEQELAKFPPPDENAVITIMKELSQLKARIAEIMSLEAVGRDRFPNRLRDLFKDLAREFRDRAPELTVVTPGWTPTTIELHSSGEEDDSSPTKKTKVSTARSVSTTPKRPRQGKTRKTAKSNASEALSQQASIKLSLGLDELAQRLDSAPGADLPGETDTRVLRKFMQDSLKGWPSAVDELFKGMASLLEHVLNEALLSIDARRGTEFHAATSACVAKFRGELLKQLQSRFSDAVASELHTPFTVSRNYNTEMGSLKLQYRNLRNVQRVKEYVDALPEGVKRPSDLEQTKKATDLQWIADTLGDDDHEREVQGFVRVAAYYNTAYSQLVDQLSKATHFHLLNSFDARLYERLIKELNVDNQSHCESLLVTDSNQRRLRQQLVAEHHKITQALEELGRLSQSKFD